MTSTSGLTQYGNNWYLTGLGPAIWNQAYYDCHNRGLQLVSVATPDLMAENVLAGKIEMIDANQ